MAKRKNNQFGERKRQRQRPVGSNLLLVGAAASAGQFLMLDCVQAVHLQAQQQVKEGLQSMAEAELGLSAQLGVQSQAAAQAQVLAEQRIDAVQKAVTDAFTHAVQGSSNSASSAELTEQATASKLSEQQLNQQMLEYLYDVTFSSVMTLDKQQSDKEAAKGGHVKSPSGKQPKDHVLVQTQAELESKNQSDLKQSILQFNCLVGSAGQQQNQCIYQDQESLLKGRMTQSARVQLEQDAQAQSASMAVPPQPISQSNLQAQQNLNLENAGDPNQRLAQKRFQGTPSPNDAAGYKVMELRNGGTQKIPSSDEERQAELASTHKNFQIQHDSQDSPSTAAVQVSSGAQLRQSQQENENKGSKRAMQVSAQSESQVQNSNNLQLDSASAHTQQMQAKALQKLKAENEELLRKLEAGRTAKKYKAAQNVLMKNLNQDEGGQEAPWGQFSQLNVELHDQAQELAGPPVKASQGNLKKMAVKDSSAGVDIKALEKKVSSRVENAKKEINKIKSAKTAVKTPAATQDKQQLMATAIQQKQTVKPDAAQKSIQRLQIKPSIAKQSAAQIPSQKCPEQKKCPACSAPAKPQDSLIQQLADQGNEFKIQISDDGGASSSYAQTGAGASNVMEFAIIPKNARDAVTNDVQVLNSERIIGYSTYSNILDKDKQTMNKMDDSDYYNVTVNLVVKKGSDYAAWKPKELAQAPTPTQEQTTLQTAVEDEQALSVGSLNEQRKLQKMLEQQQQQQQRQQEQSTASTSFEAAASLTTNEEESAELAESENYTSKIARAQAQSLVPPKPKQEAVAQAVPPQDMNAQTDDKALEQAILNAEKNYNIHLDTAQLLEKEDRIINPELQGVAASSFSAAASVGKYTGDIPQEDPDQQQVQVEGMTTDQAIELAERRQNALEQQSVLQIHQNFQMKPKSQIDDEQLAARPKQNQFTDIVVPQEQQQAFDKEFNNIRDDNKQQLLGLQQNEESQESEESDEHKHAIEAEEREARLHEEFMERLRKREEGQIKYQKAKTEGKQDDQKDESTSVEGSAETTEVAQQSDSSNSDKSHHDGNQRLQLATASANPGTDNVQSQLNKIYEATNFVEKAQKSGIWQAGNEEDEDAEEEVTAERSHRDEIEQQRSTTKRIVEDMVDENAHIDQHTEEASEEVSKDETEQGQEEPTKVPQQSISQAEEKKLEQRRMQLESHIQKEIQELTDIVNKEFGHGEHVYDYELVKITNQEVETQDKAEQKNERKESIDPELEQQEKLLHKAKQEHQKLKKQLNEANKNSEVEEHDIRSQKLDKTSAAKNVQKPLAAGTLKKLDNGEHEQIKIKQIKQGDESVHNKKDALKVHKLKQHQEKMKKQLAVEQEKLKNENEDIKARTQELQKQLKDQMKSDEKILKHDYLKKETQALEQRVEDQMNSDEKILKHDFNKRDEHADNENVQAQTDIRTNSDESGGAGLSSAHRNVLKAQIRVKEAAKQAAEAKAKVVEAHQVKSQLNTQVQSEAQAREKLYQKANELAEADLQAKSQLKLAAQAAAEAQKRKVSDFKQRLEAQALEWLSKREHLEAQESAYKKAQDEAQNAELAEAKEKKSIDSEAKEREELDKQEYQKAQEKILEAETRAELAKENAKQKEREHSNAVQVLKEHESKSPRLKQDKQSEEDTRAKATSVEIGQDSRKGDPKELSQQEINQIQKELLEAQNQAEQYEKEKSRRSIQDRSNQQTQAEIMMTSGTQTDAEATALAEAAAVEYVKEAERKGEKIGAAAATKFAGSMKDNNEVQNLSLVNQLKKKLINTSEQVQNIISNFQNVHKELLELKQEFIQQQNQANQEIGQDDIEDVALLKQSAPVASSSVSTLDQGSQLQLSEHIHMRSAAKMQERLETLKGLIKEKKTEIKNMMANFETLKQDLAEVELPQLGDTSPLASELADINEFKDQIYLQIQTSFQIASKDIEEAPKDGAAQKAKFSSVLKSQLSSYLRGDSKSKPDSHEPEDTTDIQLTEDSGLFEHESETEEYIQPLSDGESFVELAEELDEAQRSNHLLQDRIQKLIE